MTIPEVRVTVPSLQAIGKVTVLRDRASLLALVREFFTQRGVLEVDCPLISRYASIDVYIDLIEVQACGDTRFLITSPEYPMKRLMAMGLGDIYQLSHVFRDGEHGKKHSPEFTMIEWYRIGFSFEEIIAETILVMELFLGRSRIQKQTYREALIKYAGIDYVTASNDDLCEALRRAGCPPAAQERDTLLDQIMAMVVEPHLPRGCWQVITHFPSTHAGLASIVDKEGEPVAERFEVYFDGVELANGYHELTNASEQLRRCEEANRQRGAQGKGPLPIDTHFLAALQQGIPPCCGVAVGFDRLMMLRHRKEDIASVMAFGWDDA